MAVEPVAEFGEHVGRTVDATQCDTVAVAAFGLVVDGAAESDVDRRREAVIDAIADEQRERGRHQFGRNPEHFNRTRHERDEVGHSAEPSLLRFRTTN